MKDCYDLILGEFFDSRKVICRAPEWSRISEGDEVDVESTAKGTIRLKVIDKQTGVDIHDRYIQFLGKAIEDRWPPRRVLSVYRKTEFEWEEE